MTITPSAALMDAIVLSVVARDGTYGYKITQDIRSVMEISESTLYPVLRRLQKEGYLDVYDQEFAGRNRRYYRITPKGGTRRPQQHSCWRSRWRSGRISSPGWAASSTVNKLPGIKDREEGIP